MSTEVLDRGDEIEQVQTQPETPATEPEVKVEAATPEEAAPAATEEGDERPRDESGKFIPKGVFDNRLRAEREAREAAERRAIELETQMGQISRSVDVQKLDEQITEMEKQHAKWLLDGEHEKAAEVMGKIRLTERQIAIQQATAMTSQAKEQAREEIRLDLAIERLETAYPEMNPQSESYDQEKVDDVLSWQRIYMERLRLNPSAALVKAAEKVMTTSQAQAPSKQEPGLGAVKDAAAGRQSQQLQKNIQTAKAQPPDMASVGLDSDKAGMKGSIDPTQLSYEEFNALPESTKAKLRGDMV
jgi:hypothetical protein